MEQDKKNQKDETKAEEALRLEKEAEDQLYKYIASSLTLLPSNRIIDLLCIIGTILASRMDIFVKTAIDFSTHMFDCSLVFEPRKTDHDDLIQ